MVSRQSHQETSCCVATPPKQVPNPEVYSHASSPQFGVVLSSVHSSLQQSHPEAGRPQEMPLPFDLLSELLLHTIGIFRRRLSRDHFFLDRLLFERKKPFFRGVASH